MPPRTRSLYRASNLDDKYVPLEEEGRFLSARLWEGGPAWTQFDVRLDGCAIEVLRAEHGDDGITTPWLVIERIAIRPGASIWTR
ncbi:MAG: hypothetical protein JWP01_957 [Myxococcales bacterium]|nr:hypothetical protein [Myxococcales bacterium]